MMFSIVIPTRARPDTLRHALRTVMAQTDGDFEVIVHESGEDPATAAAVAEFDDRRIRYFKTGEPVRMTENWERALAHVRGDYVLFIGDDDGLLPDACAVARSILQAHPNDILSWSHGLASYYWPRYFDPELANWLFASCGEKLDCAVNSSRLLLELFYRFRKTYMDLPMVYNSFVPRSLIERVRRLRGCYFLGSYPDVSSGIVNLCFSSEFLRCNRPLSVNGASHHSSGHAFTRSGDGEMQARATALAYGEVPLHPTMIRSFDQTLCIANDMLNIKQELFPDKGPQLSYAQMLEETARHIHEIPSQYDAVLADCRAIARMNGIDFDESQLLPREPIAKSPRRERREVQFGTIFLELDGSRRGFTNVSDVAAALARELPPATIPEFSAAVEQTRHIAFPQDKPVIVELDSPVTLDFSSHGNGELVLGRGWGITEHWGVYSIGEEAELSFPLKNHSSDLLTFRLIGFVFLPPRTMTICLKLGSNILWERELRVTDDRVDIELPAVKMEASKSANNLEMIIRISKAKTPMEADVCPDPRRVGFGLERVVIRPPWMFSIVIPTRARADTLRHALKTVLAQTDRDFEVIVHESGEDPATAAAVAEFDDPRIRFFKTGEPVRMTENWERALAHVRGDYVLFIGDDDGLLPDACAVARSILEIRRTEILSWTYASYYWPGYINPEVANWLVASCGEKLNCTVNSSRLLLELFYRFRKSYMDLPTIYSSFVSRSLIERVRRLRGCYFLGSYPDVSSGVVNLCFSNEFLHCNRPLSINGASHHSSGHALTRSGDGAMQARVMALAFGEVPVHPTMVRSFDFTLCIANEMLNLKQELFPDKDPQLSYAQMLEEAARHIHEIPSQYDTVLADCRAVARINGIDFDETHLLPRESIAKSPRRERREVQSGTIFLDLDGSRRGFTNVSDVAAALARELPPATIPEFSADVEQTRHIAVARDKPVNLDLDNSVTLDFSSRGNGELVLGRGWSITEDWGVYSIGEEAKLSFPLETYSGGFLTFRLIGFVFSPPRTMTVFVKLGSNILWKRELRVTEDRIDIKLPPVEMEASALAKSLEMIIGISKAETPMEAGISPDPRRVGFGLERIVIRMIRPQTWRSATASRMFRRRILSAGELTV
jgi:glycosyltransferase involved in cell wall biosynthesis